MHAEKQHNADAGRAWLSEDGKVLVLAGTVHFDNASAVYRQLQDNLADTVEEVDCSGMEHADSTALALLLVALGELRERNRALRITGMNKRLQSLAEVYGVDDLLAPDSKD